MTEREKFNEWWKKEIEESGAWTTLERLAALDAWLSRAEMDKVKIERLKNLLENVFAILDVELGDTDPFVDEEITDEELKLQEPLLWCAKSIIAELKECVE